MIDGRLSSDGFLRGERGLVLLGAVFLLEGFLRFLCSARPHGHQTVTVWLHKGRPKRQWWRKVGVGVAIAIGIEGMPVMGFGHEKPGTARRG
jgi:hypothetical protein